MKDAYSQSDHAIIYRMMYIFLFWWAMRDFIFQTQQPLLTVFRCLFSCIYWLEAPRKKKALAPVKNGWDCCT